MWQTSTCLQDETPEGQVGGPHWADGRQEVQVRAPMHTMQTSLVAWAASRQSITKCRNAFVLRCCKTRAIRQLYIKDGAEQQSGQQFIL